MQSRLPYFLAWLHGQLLQGSAAQVAPAGLRLSPFYTGPFHGSVTLHDEDTHLLAAYEPRVQIDARDVTPLLFMLRRPEADDIWELGAKQHLVQHFKPRKYPPAGFSAYYDLAGKLTLFSLSLDAHEELLYGVEKGYIIKAALLNSRDPTVAKLRELHTLPTSVTEHGGLLQLAGHGIPTRWDEQRVFRTIEQFMPSLQTWYAAMEQQPAAPVLRAAAARAR